MRDLSALDTHEILAQRCHVRLIYMVEHCRWRLSGMLFDQNQ